MSEQDWKNCARELDNALRIEGCYGYLGQTHYLELMEQELVKKNAVWTLEQGLDYIRPLEAKCFDMGFNIGLMGSCLHRGWSNKDLDIVAVPANWRDGEKDTTLKVNCEKFLAWIKEQAGPDSEYRTGLWNNMTVHVTYKFQGRLVDWFVSFSSEEGRPET